MSNFNIFTLFLIGAVGDMVWAARAYFDPSLRGAFLTFNVSMATGVIGLALREMPTGGQGTPTLPVVTMAPVHFAPVVAPPSPTPAPPSVEPIAAAVASAIDAAAAPNPETAG